MRIDRRNYVERLEALDAFCEEHDIMCNVHRDSFYFELNGKRYRVSNHSIKANWERAYSGMRDDLKPLYHPNGYDKSIIYIHAGKFRVPQIYEDIRAGYDLNLRGYRKKERKQCDTHEKI